MHYSVDDLDKIILNITSGTKVFLYGDLGSGKTTFVKSQIKKLIGDNINITSPTYIHYRKYLENIYHFDLYRLTDYNDFINIGGEEILDNELNICFIEWPEILEKYYKPNYSLTFNKIDNCENFREIIISN